MDGNGKAYAKWYDENIGKYDIDPKTGIGLLDGRSCWKLRCEFLHSGSVDLDNFMSVGDRHITFKLIASKCSTLKGTMGGYSSVSFSKDKKNQSIEMDIVIFCGQILAVFKHSYLTDNEFIQKTNNRILNYREYD